MQKEINVYDKVWVMKKNKAVQAVVCCKNISRGTDEPDTNVSYVVSDSHLYFREDEQITLREEDLFFSKEALLASL